MHYWRLLLISLCFSLFGLLPFFITHAATSGTLIKASTPAVYYLAEDNKRYVFPNQKIFDTWYYDFSTVQTISDSELASYPLGGNIFYRPGTRLVKVQTNPSVYAVTPNGVLREIPSESVAIALYGSNWNTQIDDIPDAFFTGYTFGEPLTESLHPEGTLIQYEGDFNLYYLDYVDNSPVAKRLSTSAQISFRIQAGYVETISPSFNYAIGDDFMVETRHASPAQPKSGSTPVIETPTEIPSVAEVTVSRAGYLPTKIKGVRGKQATLYSIDIKNTSSIPVTLKKLDLQFFINADTSEQDDNDKEEEYADFLRHADTDGVTERIITDVVSNIQLTNHSTGKNVGSLSRIISGTNTISTLYEIPAGETHTIDITGNITTVYDPEVLFSVDVIRSGLLIESQAPTTNITAPEFFNGQTTPSTTVSPVEQGVLTVDSLNQSGDQIVIIPNSATLYTLTLSAQWEDFTVQQLQFQMTPAGDDFLGVKQLEISYPNSNGQTETEIMQSSDGIFLFSSLDISIPENEFVQIPVKVIPISNTDEFSGTRTQLEFKETNFRATAKTSEKNFTQQDFLHDDRLINDTTKGPLLVFRYAYPSLRKTADSPSGTVNRFSKSDVIKFTIKANLDDIELKKITFKITTNDVGNGPDQDGSDVDMLEALANLDTHDRATLYRIEDDGDEVALTGFLHTYSIMSKQLGQIFNPVDYNTAKGDYGLITYDFGTFPQQFQSGLEKTYLLKLNTATIPLDRSATLQISILNDEQSTTLTNANFQWDDGSDIFTSGYLVSGLPVNGGQLGFSQLTTINP